MTHGGDSAGYTIVEVLIFLAVTAALFAGAVKAVSGKQASVQFSQAVRDTQSKVDDIINQVASGFYPSTDSYTCTATTGTPAVPQNPIQDMQFSMTASEQGSSDGCTYLGKVLQFTDGDGTDGAIKYNLISVAGRRYNGKQQEIVSLAEALPKAIAPNSAAQVSSMPDITEKSELSFGIKVTRITVPTNPINPATGKYPVGSHGTDYGAIAFFSSLPSFSNNNANQGAGTQKVSVAAVPSTTLTGDDYQAVNSINDIIDDPAPSPVPPGKLVIRFNPVNGIVICLADQGDNKKAMVTIGGSVSRTTTKLDIGTYDTEVCP